MFQGQDTEILVQLYESGYEDPFMSIPASGIIYSDLTMAYWAQGMIAFDSFTLTSAMWTEIGDGLYILRIPGTLLQSFGQFALRLTGGLIRQYDALHVVYPVPAGFNASPNKCVVSGNIIDITGMAPQDGEEIVFRIAQIPKSVNGSLINYDRIKTRHDAYGNFSVSLIRELVVVIEMRKAGINYQFTVPDQATAALIDLLPPL